MKLFGLENKLLTNGIITIQAAEGESCTRTLNLFHLFPEGRTLGKSRRKAKFGFSETKPFLMIRVFPFQMQNPQSEDPRQRAEFT